MINYSSYSQVSAEAPITDTLSNSISWGFEKMVNTYYFNLNGKYNNDILGGLLSVDQKFRETILDLSTQTIRDDETFVFNYNFPINDNLYILANQNWILSSDSRTIGLNKLERINGKAGLRYQIEKNIFADFLAGLESNEQVGNRSDGYIITLNGYADNIKFDIFNFESLLFAEYLKLKDNRKNSDLDWKIKLNSEYDENNRFNADARYKIMGRDFLSSITSAAGTINDIESRLENRANIDAALNFQAFSFLSSDILISYLNTSIDRSYTSPVADVPSTAVKKELSEMQMSFSLETSYLSRLFRQSIGISWFSRNEENNLSKKFEINTQTFDELKELEYQRNNQSTRIRLWTKTQWTPTANDILKIDFSIMLFQYDTPSSQNSDDRDEQTTVANINYYHKYSDILSLSLNLETQLNHQVYLKASRSAMNNWNRILRFYPIVHIRTKYLTLNPQFEVLANYLVYDFEDLNTGVKSYSFRQISYSDSIYYQINNRFGIQGKITTKYFERGVLVWDSFAESPQNSNMENFIKLLFCTKPTENTEFACGMRFYMLEQKNLVQLSAFGTKNYSQKSYGPETYFKIFFKNLTLTLNGWHEILYINNLKYKSFPNIFFVTKLKI